MWKRIVELALVGFLLSMIWSLTALSAYADDWDKRTKITVNQPFEIPGMILPAGTYTLSLPGPGEDANRTGDLDILCNAHVYEVTLGKNGRAEGVRRVPGGYRREPGNPCEGLLDENPSIGVLHAGRKGLDLVTAADGRRWYLADGGNAGQN